MTTIVLCLMLSCGQRGGHATLPPPRGGQAAQVTNVQLGRSLASSRSWTGQEWLCLYQLWNKESGWKTRDPNPWSQADGIPQANPASKMGYGWQSDPVMQIRWGLGYIAARYGTPCNAWQHSVYYNWY
jgi:resuscitation-promoting factor RpfB